ncbi:LysR family transcriptional regulator [Edaphobacter flagellatus]|uniref:LysR family transcriptional regulator n=1 Tax=Edaphobacter flagellatus TaxID=1933044 RepID=UPI0021B45BEA|nr:LysR family transcriptional regulator [Edaphobacter flagellatus]
MSDIVEFRHLEYLVAIAERRNFSKAAEHVLRSQPAISHQIKMVEADIGYPLLVRDGRNGVHPTPAGEFVLAWARVILPQKKETFRMAKAIHDGTVPPLRMGFSSFVNSFLLDNFRLVYQGMFPDCEIQLSGADTQHVLERLEAGTLDCALLPMPIDRDRWDVREVAHSPLVICMRSDDALSTQVQVDIREVAQRLKVFRDPELHPAAHARLSEMFSELGIDLHLASSAATPADIQMMVKQGYGLALIDQLWPLDAGLITRPLAGLKWTADFAFVTARGQKHMALMFIERYLDEHGLGDHRKQPQPAAVRHPKQLTLVG